MRSIEHALAAEGFMPHGMCYLWQPGVLTLNIVSDGLITLAYLSIPFSLLVFVRKRTNLELDWIFLCFAVFIVSCGMSHLMEIVTVWYPMYWLAGGIKAITAFASVATSCLLMMWVPKALRVPSPSSLQRANVDLEREVGERTRAEERLKLANTTLEIRMAERVAELKMLNEKLLRDKARFEIAADAAGLGFWTLEVESDSLEHLFGYTRAELIGRQVEVLVPARFRRHHPEFREGFFDAPRARARAMGVGRDLYGLRKDGSEMPVEIGLNPLRTSEGEFVLSSIVDLSQRQEVNRLRADFVSTVSHELRTPLTSISGSLGLLQSGALGALPEKAAAMVGIASKNSTRLVRIINDILDIGKLEAGQLTSSPARTPANRRAETASFHSATTSSPSVMGSNGFPITPIAPKFRN
jgi:PAS domain S-box-containing protein